MPERPEEPPVWISSEAGTFVSKFGSPALAVGLLIGVPVYLLLTTGRISIEPEAYFFVGIVVVVFAITLPVDVRLLRVGYQGGDLLLNNYRCTVRVPLRQITEVEPVPLGRGEVRICFDSPTPFGRTVSYLPCWAALRNMFGTPQRELLDAIEADRKAQTPTC